MHSDPTAHLDFVSGRESSTFRFGIGLQKLEQVVMSKHDSENKAGKLKEF